jgi:hypothetical protein
MDYERLMAMSYGERGLTLRVCLDNKEFINEIRKKYRECKGFADISESAIYRILGEVFCLSVESVERCIKGKDINCCFYTGRQDD